MAVPVEEGVLNALRGVVSDTTRLPQPLIIKVYISSIKDEFNEERRVILEQVGPELQTFYDDRQIEIEIIDMHFGTGPDSILMTDIDPYIVKDYLHEIETCHRTSKSIFFITLIGNKVGEMCLPLDIEINTFQAILGTCKQYEKELLERWYVSDNKEKFLLKDDYWKISQEDWLRTKSELIKIFQENCEVLQETIRSNNIIQQELRAIQMPLLQKEIDKALELSPERIFVIFREKSNKSSSSSSLSEMNSKVHQIKNKLTATLPAENCTTLKTSGNSTNTLNRECDDHEAYLNKFKIKMIEKMRNLIEQGLTNDPDVIKGRKKTVQEIFHEHSTHLRFLHEHLESKRLITSTIPDRLRLSCLQSYRSGSRHAPFFIYGTHGSGKSSLIADLYNQVNEWFHHSRVHRIVRFASATPRSAYNLELLRVICQQISIIFNIPEGYLPKDASFDPLYISNWFQNLVKRCEDMNNEILYFFIDDLHKLNPLDCDIAASLSWIPISLPWNVYLICTTNIPIDQLKFTPIQKDRFKGSDSLFDMSFETNKTVVRMPLDSKISFKEYIEHYFDKLEAKYGRVGFGKLASYITCSEYGLTETELLELLMPTESSEAMIDTKQGNFNFSTFHRIHSEMGLLIREKIMSGKVLIEWRHPLSAEIAKVRYMDTNSIRSMHTEIANIFFNQETEESEETTSERSAVSGSNKVKDESSKSHDDTSILINPPGFDVSYSIRHVEESWHHLMRSEDTNKFKQIAVCNFDFLLAAVQTVSISYLRCLIEHVRCYILDRDIELIYYTIRKSSDVLTRDPMQLGAQLISWLRPINEHDENDNSLLSITVRSATAWCDGYTVPLLVPLTGWLAAPLPSQIRTMTVSGTGPIRDIALAPSKQHLIIATTVGDVQLWHIMSNSLVYTFKGHSATVTCMLVPSQTNLLVTGSEDKSVILWNIDNRNMNFRISEHTAAVISVTTDSNNTLIISGGEDCSIIISNLQSSQLLTKIDYHRGPVTSVKVSSASDVLISSSCDKKICLWSLDDYSLLNCIQINKAVLRMEISADSVFLLAYCDDNGLYLRTLATGTELHPLKGHKSKVRVMTIAMDSQRAIIGCDDTRALIFDMHSGRLIRSFPPNPGPVTALYVMENDDFLITVGGNKITFYSFRSEEIYTGPYTALPKKRKVPRLMPSQRSMNAANLPPVTCFDISRDSQLAAVCSSKIIHILQINTPQLQTTFEGHSGLVTCVCFSPNSEFIASGSEDKTVNIWILALRITATVFKGHNATISCVVVLMDSRRIISSDKDGLLYVWLADSGTLLQTVQGPYKHLAATNNMKFAICTNGDNSLKIWSLTREDEKYTVSHSDEITCFVITVDSLYIITGSKDMSLKVWQATGGKLAQVLVGHSNAVTCVALSATNKTQVISGSKDCNLIIWDIHTGEEIHTLAGHLAQVTCVKVSADGSTAVSGSDDKTLIVWETKRGLALTSLQLHVPFTRFDISLECSRILVQLVDNFNLPVICLHNTPASYVKLPTYSAPARDVEDLRPAGPKRQMRRLLKKEVSLDTYTWQKKYGHLTSSVMMAQVDERLKRRFSVSASMEEISKIAEMKSIASQASIGPEQAALAQSQHFDQLEALWNKHSPPRRRHNTSLSRQSSLVEDRIESSDEDDFQEEKTGTFGMNTQPYITETNAWKTQAASHDHNVYNDIFKDTILAFKTFNIDLSLFKSFTDCNRKIKGTKSHNDINNQKDTDSYLSGNNTTPCDGDSLIINDPSTTETAMRKSRCGRDRYTQSCISQ